MMRKRLRLRAETWQGVAPRDPVAADIARGLSGYVVTFRADSGETLCSVVIPYSRSAWDRVNRLAQLGTHGQTAWALLGAA